MLLQLALLGLIAPTIGLSSGAPFQLATSSVHYGPDGPWQAITVGIGSQFNRADGLANGQKPLDLYPGGLWQSNIISAQACETIPKIQTPSRLCGIGGVFEANISHSLYNTNLRTWQNITGDYVNFTDVMDTITLLPASGNQNQRINVNNVSINLITSMQISAPNQAENDLQLGTLALGPLPYNMVPGNYTGPPVAVDAFEDPSYHYNGIHVNTTFIPNAVAAQGNISSASYGLHIGSATLGPPLSLWIGGYDRSRVIGDVSAQRVSSTDTLQIDLLDISIGVESGPSPFDVPLQQGLLTRGNNSLGNYVSVTMDSTRPYLYLPGSACSAIAETLPITYDEGSNLYTWNTDDVRYSKIINSSSYLGFTFRSGSGGNLTINVPFALLNLTLDTPFVLEPIPYFPCQPPSKNITPYTLGRAFLQAAFIGLNWDLYPGQWYLSQAPGPNIPSQPSQASFSATPTPASNVTWADTWNGSSTSSSSAAANATPIPPSGSTGLSGGAKAGVVIGVLGAFAAIAAALYLRCKYRRDKPETSSSKAKIVPDFNYPCSKEMSFASETSKSAVNESGEKKLHEAPDNWPMELGVSDHGGNYELAGDTEHQ